MCVYFPRLFPGISLSDRQIDHYTNGISDSPDRKHRRGRTVYEEKYQLGVLLSIHLIQEFIINKGNDALDITLLIVSTQSLSRKITSIELFVIHQWNVPLIDFDITINDYSKVGYKR